MATGPDDFDQNIENLKATVKQSFARIYAAVRAREQKTLLQLDAIRKQCQNEKQNRVQNVHVSYDNESILLENVSKYGLIDLEKLNFDNSTFTLEAHISPDDHLYTYKTIEDLALEEGTERHRNRAENCVCFLNVRSRETSKQFRNVIIETESIKPPQESAREDNKEGTEDEKSDSSDPEVVKINPTDDWLNSIKSQTETEPSQAQTVLEFISTACSYSSPTSIHFIGMFTTIVCIVMFMKPITKYINNPLKDKCALSHLGEEDVCQMYGLH